MFDSPYILLGLIPFFALLLEIMRLREFKNRLERPFKRIKFIEYKTKYKEEELLYHSYKGLPLDLFRIIKIHLKAKDTSNTILLQVIEFLYKFVITAAFAIAGIIITLSFSLLNYVKDNEEIKADHTNWLNNISGIFNTINKGMDFYQDITMVCLIVFSVVAAQILIGSLRSRLHRLHLTVIEEIENERKYE